jgi:hypothetical protein
LGYKQDTYAIVGGVDFATPAFAIAEPNDCVTRRISSSSHRSRALSAGDNRATRTIFDLRNRAAPQLWKFQT